MHDIHVYRFEETGTPYEKRRVREQIKEDGLVATTCWIPVLRLASCQSGNLYAVSKSPPSMVSLTYDFQTYRHSKHTLSLYIRTASTAGGKSCRRPRSPPSLTSRIRQPGAPTLDLPSRSLLVPEADLMLRISSAVL